MLPRTVFLRETRVIFFGDIAAHFIEIDLTARYSFRGNERDTVVDEIGCFVRPISDGRYNYMFDRFYFPVLRYLPQPL